MALTYLGGLPLSACVPLLGTAVREFVRTVVDEIEAVEADARALQADVAALQGDLAGLLGDLGDPQGILENLLQQLAAGPLAYVKGIEAAIAAIVSGLTLDGLKQALLAGPTIFLQSIEAAIAQVTGKIADIQARIATVEGRIVGVLARVAALAERILALKDLQLRLGDWTATLGVAGVHAYAFTGSVAGLGAEVDGELGGGPPGGTAGDVGAGFLFIATGSASITALNKVFLP